MKIENLGVVESHSLTTMVVADKVRINETVNLPNESVVPADKINHSPGGPSFKYIDTNNGGKH